LTDKRKYFGTDGIRGKAGISPMVPEFIVKLGWAIGTVLVNQGQGRIVMGKDTRITGYMFESALEAGFAAAGMDTYLLGPMPTPGIAYLTKSMEFDAGIVISASHNLYEDNGIKIFASNGMKLSDEIENQIEALLDTPLHMVAPEKVGRAYRLDDAVKRYIDFCKSTVPAKLTLEGLKIVMDCANGANYYIGPRVFSDLGAQVVTINNTPNGLNINEQCGSTAPTQLQQAVLHESADLGIAFDGDGDRLIMVDHRGELVDGDELLLILALSAQQQGLLKGGVVGTLMSNLGLELALQKANIPFMRSKVGDRYVLEILQEQQWQIGGEPSGHIIHLGHSTTGDAIVAALLVVAEIVRTQQPLHALKKHMQKCPQTMINVRVSHMADPLSKPAIQTAITEANAQLQHRGRVLLRASGTEPVIRVMVEGMDTNEVQHLAQQLAAVVETAYAEK
jgi:phosphoglucosamine mutase